jgi:hypothetical protein
MAKIKILQEGQSYTFRSYFELPYEADDILAVTMGYIWQFGKLERSTQQITQDINLFKVPDDLDSLVRVLMGILEGE